MLGWDQMAQDKSEYSHLRLLCMGSEQALEQAKYHLREIPLKEKALEQVRVREPVREKVREPVREIHLQKVRVRVQVRGPGNLHHQEKGSELLPAEEPSRPLVQL